jgi:acyl dehydratase
MRERRLFEDFTPGETFRSGGLTVTETHIVSWSSLTGDWTWLHTDAEKAAHSVFGERVAHGPFTFAAALGLVTQTGMLGDGIIAWLGADELRLPAPVRLGDTITVHCTVLDCRPSRKGDRGTVELGYEVRTQNDQTVMAFRSSFLIRRAGARDDPAPAAVN